ncbi:unnamed protein product [Microthlaspi erraticum]|uniref:Uncharacterized protein n=1 Tax=Microthlaspi erraticum TaxID=1685480 RepID=A0A6D2J3Q3_9BRAS|nr:unnamed protein product [Microthlaspi erraticum]
MIPRCDFETINDDSDIRIVFLKKRVLAVVECHLGRTSPTNADIPMNHSLMLRWLRLMVETEAGINGLQIIHKTYLQALDIYDWLHLDLFIMIYEEKADYLQRINHPPYSSCHGGERNM